MNRAFIENSNIVLKEIFKNEENLYILKDFIEEILDIEVLEILKKNILEKDINLNMKDFKEIANFMVLIVSIILLAIDISTKQALYKSLGELPTIIIMIGILLAPILYEVFLAVWWSLASRDSPKNLQIKKLKKIKKNNKKLKKKQN